MHKTVSVRDRKNCISTWAGIQVFINSQADLWEIIEPASVENVENLFLSLPDIWIVTLVIYNYSIGALVTRIFNRVFIIECLESREFREDQTRTPVL